MYRYIKVGVDDVNQALTEVSRELEGKCSMSALEAAIREQGGEGVYELNASRMQLDP